MIGKDVLIKAVRNIFKGQLLDENFLMFIATIGAFSLGEFSEGAAVMLFYKVGELLQDMAVNRSRKSIAELMNIRPDYANLKPGKPKESISKKSILEVLLWLSREKEYLRCRIIEKIRG